MTLIGVFLLVFGLLYKLRGDAWSYLQMTGTIYLASLSTLLIACCYWKRANNWGAAAAIVVGAVLPVSYLAVEQVPATQHLAKSIGPNFAGIAAFLGSGLAMACVASYATITVYVAIRGTFDIKEMLQRLADDAGQDNC